MDEHTKTKRVPIYVDPDIRSTIMQLRQENQTCNDVIETSITQTVQNAISPLMFERLSAIGHYPLHEPIKCDVWFKKDLRVWCVENRKLALLGMGVSLPGILASLEEALEGHILSFTEFPDEKHSEDSLTLKKDLMEQIDFAGALQQIHKKYGENITTLPAKKGYVTIRKGEHTHYTFTRADGLICDRIYTTIDPDTETSAPAGKLAKLCVQMRFAKKEDFLQFIAHGFPEEKYREMIRRQHFSV